MQAESSRNYLDDKFDAGLERPGGRVASQPITFRATITRSCSGRPLERLAEILAGEIERHESTMGKILLR